MCYKIHNVLSQAFLKLLCLVPGTKRCIYSVLLPASTLSAKRKSGATKAIPVSPPFYRYKARHSVLSKVVVVVVAISLWSLGSIPTLLNVNSWSDSWILLSPREDLLVRIASLAALLDTTIFILQLTSRPSPFLPVGNQAIDSPCVNVMGPSLTLSLLSPEASLATFCFLS